MIIIRQMVRILLRWKRVRPLYRCFHALLAVGILIINEPVLAQGQKMNAQEVLNQLDIRWQQLLPLQVQGHTMMSHDKKVRAQIDGAWVLSNPGVASFPIPMESKTFFEWAHDGERMLSKRRLTDPLAQEAPPLPSAGAWDSVRLWDGHSYITQTLETDDKNIPMRVTVIPSDFKLTSGENASVGERLAIAKTGLDLLICAPDGRSWSAYMKGRKLEVSQGVWQEQPCILLSWQEEQVPGSTSTIFVVPNRSYAVVRQETIISGDLTFRNEIKSFQQFRSVWLPKQSEIVVYAKLPGSVTPVPKVKVALEVDQWRVAVAMPKETFEFVEDQLPRGSKVDYFGKRVTRYIGAEVTEADVMQLSAEVRQYLLGKRSPQSVERVLPEQKRLSFPGDCGPYSLLAVCRILEAV